jgi:transposase InsO family protein
MKRDYTMESLYNYLGISRQSISQSRAREKVREKQETLLLEKVIEYRDHHPRIGSRPLYYTMKNSGENIPIGINKFEHLLNKKGLTVGTIRSRYPKTSDGKGKESYENLTNGLLLNGINQLIVADITYFDISECRTYIFTLKDVYSQRILSLRPSKNMYHENALMCLEDMIMERKSKSFAACVHHSDNGSQYNADNYKRQLQAMNIQISRAGNCVENGSSEQLNHIAKNMYLEPWGIQTMKELISACLKLKKLNNEQGAIYQLGNLSPCKFELKINEMPVEMRPIKEMYDFANWT